MAKVSPQRIIAEAIRLIEKYAPPDDEDADNNVQELAELSRRLHQANTTAI